MKNIYFTLILFHISFFSIAQIHFEKGYYIDNNGIKHHGLIKNVEWKNNPDQFEFKQNDLSLSEKLHIQEVSEFSVKNLLYKRFSLPLDRSSSVLGKLDAEKNPVFKIETFFLLLLVEGEQNLYSYNDNTLSRYFFGTNDQDIEQLVYKKYMRNQSEIGTNNLYQQQIASAFKCQSISQNRIQKTPYKKNELIALFKEYNLCIDPNITFSKKENTGSFQLSLKTGLILNEFKISSEKDYYQQDDFLNFGNSIGFRIGLEAEYTMPFNKNKWAVIFEPTFQYFSDSGYDYYKEPANINYLALDIPLGLRHYFFLKNNNKLFINASLVLILPLSTEVEISNSNNFLFDNSLNYSFGFGYKFLKNFSAELQFKGNQSWYYDAGLNERLSKLKMASFIVGYSFK